MPLQVKKVQMKLKDGQQYVDGDLLFNVDAQAWARGKRNGQTVSSTDPTYHNNAEYYAGQASDSASAAAQAVLTGNLAPTFSASTAYSKGDYVIYNGTLYCFTVDHAAGAWTGSDATEQTVEDALDALDTTEDIDTLAGDFAATYVPDQAYSVGDYCTNQYQLYQCKTAIAANTDHFFVDSHWNLITVTDTLTNQAGDLKNEIKNTDPFVYTGNLFNYESITPGKLLNSSGIETVNSSGGYSDYIPCEENTDYTITRFRGVFGGTFVAAVFYNGSNSVIGYYKDNTSQSTDSSITFTTPSACKYMRVNVGLNGANSAILVKGDEYPLVYIPYGKQYIKANPSEITQEQINGLSLALIDIADGLFEQGGINSGTGSEYNSDYLIRTGVLNKNICAVDVLDDVGFVQIVAFNGEEYIGIWTGSAFAKEKAKLYKIPKHIDLTQFMEYDIRLMYLRRTNINASIDSVTAINPGSTQHIQIFENVTVKDTMRDFSAGMLKSTLIEAYPGTSLSIEGTIRPVQSGEGDPSPTNVRAIGETSAINLTVGAKSYTIPLGTAIKVGKFSLKSGKYHDMGASKTFDGSETWNKIGTSTFYTSVSSVYRAPVSNNGQSDEEFACDSYKNMPASGNAMSQSGAETQYGCCLASPAFGQNMFAVNDPNYTTVDAWKAHLQTNNINIVYTSTATPAEYTISDVPEILAPYGSATVTNSAGKVSVSGTASKNTNNPLYGKKALFMGDSICYADGTDTDHCERGWAGRIGAANNMIANNWGVSGARITDTSSGHTGGKFCISDFITTAKNSVGTDMDYVILEGGTNDADLVSDAKIGTFDATDFSGTYDNTTFYGALDALFYKATSYYPNAKIGFIVAQKMGRAQQSGTERRRSFFDKAIQVCKKWGIPYIDLWEEGQINPNLTVYWNSTKTTSENITAGSAYLDGQHLTSVGYDMISPKIEAWMKTL